MSLATTYLSSAIKRFQEYKSLGEKTFAQLDEKDLFVQPNEASNSIAIIIQHLHGNMLSRWTRFLTEDGEKSWRQREAEFSPRHLSKEALLRLWEEGWQVLLETLASLREEDLEKTVTIRSQPHAVVDAINRQLAHYSSHVGQIVYLGRWLKNTDWQSLSIAKGASASFNQEMQEKHKP